MLRTNQFPTQKAQLQEFISRNIQTLNRILQSIASHDTKDRSLIIQIIGKLFEQLTNFHGAV